MLHGLVVSVLFQEVLGVCEGMDDDSQAVASIGLVEAVRCGEDCIPGSLRGWLLGLQLPTSLARDDTLQGLSYQTRADFGGKEIPGMAKLSKKLHVCRLHLVSSPILLG